MPQIKFGLAPAGSAADLEEEDPAWATRVLRFDQEYKFALAEAMGVQPQLSRRKMPHLMAHIVRAVVDEAKRQGVANLDEPDDAKLVQLLPSDKVLQESLELWQAVTDVQNQDDFASAIYVYVVTDAGNKKNEKLTHRLMSAYHRGRGKVIPLKPRPREIARDGGLKSRPKEAPVARRLALGALA